MIKIRVWDINNEVALEEEIDETQSHGPSLLGYNYHPKARPNSEVMLNCGHYVRFELIKG